MSFNNYLWNQLDAFINNLPHPVTLSHTNVEGDRKEVKLNHRTRAISYKMRKTKYSLPFSDFYTALTMFHGQSVDSDKLKGCANSFRQKGCNCATFFLLLYAMGIVDDIIKTGVNNRQLEVQL